MIKFAQKSISMSFIFFFLLVFSAFSYAQTYKVESQFADVRKLSFYFDGLVSRVLVSVGEQVNQGDILAIMDQRLLDIEIQEKKQQIDEIRPAFDEVEKDYQRALELYDRSVLADKDLETAKVAFEKQKARLSLAKSRLKYLELKKAYYQLKSPYRAVIIENKFYPGILIRNNMHLSSWITLASRDKLAFYLTLPISNRHYKLGESLVVHFNKKRYSAKIKSIEYKQQKVILQLIINEKNISKFIGKKLTWKDK